VRQIEAQVDRAFGAFSSGVHVIDAAQASSEQVGNDYQLYGHDYCCCTVPLPLFSLAHKCRPPKNSDTESCVSTCQTMQLQQMRQRKH
jgi:hypothetical protein